MRPANLKTRIFLDSGDVNETRETIKILGFLDGQTTNPTLISKNPDAQKRLTAGNKFSPGEIMSFYKGVVGEISGLLPQGFVSVEVYADKNSLPQDLLNQGRDMFSWIPNAHIKYPVIPEGLAAAEQSVKEGLRVNMTLCFSEEQAGAVYAATKGAKKGDVFVSPFAGRLDDKGLNGMDIIKNIIRMYSAGDGHVEVLAASIRNINHFLYSISLGADIITAPFKVLKEWADAGMPVPDESYTYPAGDLAAIPYEEVNLEDSWRNYAIKHEMTVVGLDRFASDWNSLIAV